MNDYELMSKAARRVGRVTNYIGRYKFGIFNQNEMIKIQSFLQNQYDIFSNDRVIIHSGMMISHSSSWTSKKKRCIFFLFNDLLLRTLRNGVLQSIIHLDTCRLTPSSSRRQRDRKFEITYDREKSKLLKLECTNVRERDEWYEALKVTISAAKDTSSELWPSSESLNSDELKDHSSELSYTENKSSEFFDTSSSRDMKFASEEFRCSQSFSGNACFRAWKFEDPKPMDEKLPKIPDIQQFYAELKSYIEEMTPVRCSLLEGQTTYAASTGGKGRKSKSFKGGDRNGILSRNESRDVQGHSIEFFHQRTRRFECFHKLDRNKTINQAFFNNLEMEVESPSVYQISNKF